MLILFHFYNASTKTQLLNVYDKNKVTLSIKMIIIRHQNFINNSLVCRKKVRMSSLFIIAYCFKIYY